LDEAGSVVEIVVRNLGSLAASVRAAMVEAALRLPRSRWWVRCDCSLWCSTPAPIPLTVSSSGDDAQCHVWMDHRAIAEARQI